MQHYYQIKLYNDSIIIHKFADTLREVMNYYGFNIEDIEWMVIY